MGNGADEIERQIDTLRQRGFDNVQGSFYWNAGSVLRNSKQRDNGREMNPMLKAKNRYIALVPPMAWMDMTAPKPVSGLQVKGSAPIVEISWDANYSDNLNAFLVYKFEKGQPVDLSDPSKIIGRVRYDNNAKGVFYDKSGQKGQFTYAVTALSRNSIESTAVSETVKVTKSAVK